MFSLPFFFFFYNATEAGSDFIGQSTSQKTWSLSGQHCWRWSVHNFMLAECCFTSRTETVGLLGMGAQDGHLDFHTAPEFELHDI